MMVNKRIKELRFACQQYADFIADVFDVLPDEHKEDYDSQLKQIEEIVHRVTLTKEV